MRRLENFVKVKNISGTTDWAKLPNGYSSWKEFWEKNMEDSFGFCANVECMHHAEVGAHVRIVDDGMRWYIVPFCAGCNHLSGEITVPEDMLCSVHDA